MNKEKLLKILSKKGDEITCPIAIFIINNKALCGFRHYKIEGKNPLNVWTCPGGRCERGETVEETLKREILEETGISDFNIIDFIGQIDGSKKGDIVLIFLCKTLQSPKLIEPEKFSEWKWFTSKDLPKNFINENARKIIIDLLPN